MKGFNLWNLIRFETEGLDFVMTAMFAVIFLEQWLKDKHHISAWAGLIASVGCLVVFGPDQFLIPTMICVLYGAGADGVLTKLKQNRTYVRKYCTFYETYAIVIFIEELKQQIMYQNA